MSILVSSHTHARLRGIIEKDSVLAKKLADPDENGAAPDTGNIAALLAEAGENPDKCARQTVLKFAVKVMCLHKRPTQGPLSNGSQTPGLDAEKPTDRKPSRRKPPRKKAPPNTSKEESEGSKPEDPPSLREVTPAPNPPGPKPPKGSHSGSPKVPKTSALKSSCRHGAEVDRVR